MYKGTVLCHWSKTQSNVALSSGEAELNSGVKGLSELLGMYNLIVETLRVNPLLELYTDASACKGMLLRHGVGRVKHLSVKQLWVQEAIKCFDVDVKKAPRAENPADLLTHSVPFPTAHKQLGFINVTRHDRLQSQGGAVDGAHPTPPLPSGLTGGEVQQICSVEFEVGGRGHLPGECPHPRGEHPSPASERGGYPVVVDGAHPSLPPEVENASVAGPPGVLTGHTRRLPTVESVTGEEDGAHPTLPPISELFQQGCNFKRLGPPVQRAIDNHFWKGLEEPYIQLAIDSHFWHRAEGPCSASAERIHKIESCVSQGGSREPLSILDCKPLVSRQGGAHPVRTEPTKVGALCGGGCRYGAPLAAFSLVCLEHALGRLHAEPSWLKRENIHVRMVAEQVLTCSAAL